MRITTSLLSMIVSIGLLGCGSVPDRDKPGIGRPVPFFSPTKLCKKGNCVVSVTVQDCAHIDVPDSVLNLGGLGGGRSRLIVWVIDNQDYNFSTDGTKPGLDVKGSTNFGTPALNGPVMMVNVAVSAPGLAHEYGLNIVKSDGTKCPTYDPWVIE